MSTVAHANRRAAASSLTSPPQHLCEPLCLRRRSGSITDRQTVASQTCAMRVEQPHVLLFFWGADERICSAKPCKQCPKYLGSALFQAYSKAPDVRVEATFWSRAPRVIRGHLDLAEACRPHALAARCSAHRVPLGELRGLALSHAAATEPGPGLFAISCASGRVTCGTLGAISCASVCGVCASQRRRGSADRCVCRVSFRRSVGICSLLCRVASLHGAGGLRVVSIGQLGVTASPCTSSAPRGRLMSSPPGVPPGARPPLP